MGRRREPLCPICKVNPKHITSTNRRIGYCRECACKYARDNREKYIVSFQKANKKWAKESKPISNPTKLCCSCKLSLRSKTSSYCKDCNNEYKKNYNANMLR